MSCVHLLGLNWQGLVKLTVEERFWSKVDKTGDCWLWTGRLSPKGYGTFNLGSASERNASGNYKRIRAHVYAYELLEGAVPDGLRLDHKHTCPKRCVRPTHLRPVTDKQNQENRSGATRASITGLRGVYYRESSGRWLVYVKRKYVGSFATADEANFAARARRNEVMTHNDADRR